MIALSPLVTLVASGQHGFRTSNALDCNVYLLKGGNEYALVDAGCGLEPERIVAHIEAAGVALHQVRTVLLTHAHADHAAGAHYWRTVHGMTVVAPAEAAPWIESGDEDKTSLRPARAAGAYPADYRYPPCPLDRTVVEGDCLTIGSLTVRVLETPGHARGHVSYLFEEEGATALFTGDVIFSGGTIVLQNTWDCSIQEYAATAARLHAMQLERLYPGHKTPLLTGAHHDIERAHRIFQGLGVPPNFA